MSTSEYRAPRFDGPEMARPSVASLVASISLEAWVVALVVLVGAVVRFATISSQSFWTDEALTVYEAGLPLGAMLHTVFQVETTPPLYFVLAWGWEHVFGRSEIALRSLSTLSGLALIPIAYLCCRELASRWAGVIAAVLVAANPFLIWYSQEARAYMLLGALCGASLLWFLRARRDPSARNLRWWAIFSALAVLTHFFAGFVVFPEALWLFWVARGRPTVVAVAAVAVAQAAMVPIAYFDSGHGTEWIAASSKLSRIAGVPLEFGIKNLDRNTTTGVGLVGGATLIALVLGLLAVGGTQLTRRAALTAAAIAGAGLLAPLALAYLGQDYFIARNLMPVFPPIVVVIAIACAAPRARLAGVAVALVLVALFVDAGLQIQSNSWLQRPDWRTLARVIGPAPAQRLIIAAGGTTNDPLKIYLPGVNWVQPQNRKYLINEIDILGTRHRGFLIADSSNPRAVATTGGIAVGPAIPRGNYVRGNTLLTRRGLYQWVYARFRLHRPLFVDVHQVVGLAGRYFRQTPADLLVFLQSPRR